MMYIERLTRPEPVADIAALRSHLRISGDHDDADLTAMHAAVAHELEDAAEIALIWHEVKLTLDRWPDSNRVRLPIGPVLGAYPPFTVTADGDEISADLIPGQRPVIILPDPPPGARHAQIVILYRAGWGEAESDLPPDIRHALRDQVGALYDWRAATPHEIKAPAARGSAGLCYAMARVIGRYRGVSA